MHHTKALLLINRLFAFYDCCQNVALICCFFPFIFHHLVVFVVTVNVFSWCCLISVIHFFFFWTFMCVCFFLTLSLSTHKKNIDSFIFSNSHLDGNFDNSIHNLCAYCIYTYAVYYAQGVSQKRWLIWFKESQNSSLSFSRIFIITSPILEIIKSLFTCLLYKIKHLSTSLLHFGLKGKKSLNRIWVKPCRNIIFFCCCFARMAPFNFDLILWVDGSVFYFYWRTFLEKYQM